MTTHELIDITIIGGGPTGLFAQFYAGMRGVTSRDAGAASGVLNAAQQLGLALGLALLVVLFAAAAPGAGVEGRSALALQIEAALAGTTALLAFAGIFAAISASRVRPAK
jgi:hypothetical protein